MTAVIAPNAIEFEEALLGLLLLDSKHLADVYAVCQPEDFFLIRNRWIYTAILTTWKRGDAVDVLTVKHELEAMGKFSDAGGFVYLTQLIAGENWGHSIDTYAHLIYRAALRRRLMGAAVELHGIAVSTDTTIEEVCDQAEKKILDITRGRRWHEMPTIRELLSDQFDVIEDRYTNGEKILGVPTGFSEVDAMLEGLQPSHYGIIAGRPGMGKTSYMLAVARNAAMLPNISVGFITMEMTVDQLLNRLTAMESGIDSMRLKKGMLTDIEWQRFTEAHGRMGNWNLQMDYLAGASVRDVGAWARRVKREHGLNVLFVDYLGLMREPGKNDNRNTEVENISRGLKILAGELDCTVIAASQLSRKCEERIDKRPMLSDLRDSGALEQDADWVKFLYRPEYYNEHDKPGIAEVIVAKHRHGPTGKIELGFRASLMQFSDMKKVGMR